MGMQEKPKALLDVQDNEPYPESERHARGRVVC